jgi:hypothetical protein
MIGRVVGSAVVLGAGAVVANMGYVTRSIVSGDTAGMQFESSNQAAIINQGIQSSLSVTQDAIGLGILLVLILIWYGPIKKLITQTKETL